MKKNYIAFHFFIVAVVIVAISLLLQIGGHGVYAATDSSNSLNASNNYINMNIGDKQIVPVECEGLSSIVWSFNDDNTTTCNVTVTSSNDAVVGGYCSNYSFRDNGVTLNYSVLAKSEGSATITISDTESGLVYGTIYVTVASPTVSTVSVCEGQVVSFEVPFISKQDNDKPLYAFSTDVDYTIVSAEESLYQVSYSQLAVGDTYQHKCIVNMTLNTIGGYYLNFGDRDGNLVRKYLVNVHDHAYEVTDDIEATCQNKETIISTCSYCGDEKTEEVGELANHAWNQFYTVDMNATCIQEGSKSIHCSVCGTIDESTVTFIPKTDHTYGDWTVVKEANCSNTGLKEMDCVVCGCILKTETIEINPDAHVFVDGRCTVCGEKQVIASGECGDVSYVFYSDGELIISGNGAMYDSNEHPDYYWWDGFKSEIKTVVIENGVTSIGSYIFDGCHNLRSITIPESVTIIGEGAFRGCNSLTSITIPKSVTIIDRRTYKGCSSLTSITIPESVTGIGGEAFYGCSGLTSITIPESVTGIGGYAFSGCNNLRSITIPESVTWIGEGAFSGCSSLTSITIPEGVTDICHSTFDGCSNLTSITIPESVTSIENYAFYNCSSLENIIIPENVTSIDNYAFSECSGLKNIYLIKESYADNWFLSNGFQNAIKYVYKSGKHYCYDTIIKQSNCTESGERTITCVACGEVINESIEIDPDAHIWGDVEVTIKPDCIHDGIGVKVCKLDSSHEESVIIPATGIHNYVEGYCTTCGNRQIIENRSCGNHVSYVLYGDGDLIISGTDSMTNWSAGSAPWYSKRSLIKNVKISEGVTNIGYNAFYNCSNLTSVFIPESVTFMGYDSFSGCSSLASIYAVAGSEAAKWALDYDYDSALKIVYKSGEHYYYEEITKRPTISKTGLKTITCVICGESRTEVLPVIKPGWQKMDGKWYYYKNDGTVTTGWAKISGKWYYFEKTGIMHVGWKRYNGRWYHFDKSGAMQTGWQKINGKYYYFKSAGNMAYHEWVKGYYWVNMDGTWTYKYKGSWKKSGSRWWFGDTSGWYAKNTTITIGDEMYTFDKSGWLV